MAGWNRIRPPPEILAALRRMGRQLTGGVSSDIWLVALPGGPICVKRALPRLRVAARDALLACYDTLAQTYLAGVGWEPPAALERRAARLLPGLLLARVDGKSSVEYITDEADREVVRRVARALLADPVHRLADVRTAWREELQ